MAQQEYFGQYNQDRIVHERFFAGKTDGFYLDIGAYDGKILSNTLFFERAGWRGICVEATEEDFRKLVANRPGADCIHGAAYDRDGTIEFRRVDGAPRMLSGVNADYDPRHLERIEREIRRDGGSSTLVAVPCFRMDTLLAARGVTHVDYLSLDVEGAETAVLSGFDLARVTVDVITVEDNYGERAKFDAILGPTHDCVGRIGDCDLLYVRRR